jgi:Mg-chelatase subunit ChlD
MTAALLAALLVWQSAGPSAPLDVVLMVDVSHSMTFGLVRRDRVLVPDAAVALAAAFEPGDAARVGAFGDGITLDLTRLRSADAVRDVAYTLGEQIGGASPIWDALLAAAAALEDGSGRRGIVLVTDGRSTGNRVGFVEALGRLTRTRIPIFIVSLDKSDRPLPDPGARLMRLADATGGTCVFVDRPALAGAIARAVRALRAGPVATAR